MQNHAISCKTMPYHAIQCNAMLYHAISCNTMQYNAIPCNTMQYHGTLITACNTMHFYAWNIMKYHAIPCNTMQYPAIPCNNMQYHAIPWTINNCWRSVPLPCGQYHGHFFQKINWRQTTFEIVTFLYSCESISQSSSGIGTFWKPLSVNLERHGFGCF